MYAFLPNQKNESQAEFDAFVKAVAKVDLKDDLHLYEDNVYVRFPDENVVRKIVLYGKGKSMEYEVLIDFWWLMKISSLEMVILFCMYSE